MKLVNKKINGIEIRKAINHTDNDNYIMQVCNVFKDGKQIGQAYCYYLKDEKRRIIRYDEQLQDIRDSDVFVRELIKSYNYPNPLSAFTPKYAAQMRK